MPDLETGSFMEEHTNQIQMPASEPVQVINGHPEAQQSLPAISSESSGTALPDQPEAAEHIHEGQTQISEYTRVEDLPQSQPPLPETSISSSMVPVDHPEVAEFLKQSFIIFKDEPLQKSCAFCRYARLTCHSIFTGLKHHTSMRHDDDPDGWPSLTILTNPARDELVSHLQEVHETVWDAIMQSITGEE